MARLATAIQHRQAEQYAESEALLRGLLAETPNDPQVNYQMAWLHDAQGLEQAAVPYYERAIANGLSGEDLRGALLGLGSTYRCLGHYDKAATTLRLGMAQFPQATEFAVFLAMVRYNLGQHNQAMALLLRLLADTSNDADIQAYKKAILFYHDKLDETWT